MISIKAVPVQNLIKVFGQPGDTSNFVKISLPFEMRASWDYSKIRTFYGHEYIGEAVVDAFSEILDYYGIGWIKAHDLDMYGGCYSNRSVRGGTAKSIHAWGLAVDYIPHLGQFGKPSMIPFHCVDAFVKRGFKWGGFWDKPDAMHMSAIIE